jgi:hypothetical protein
MFLRVARVVPGTGIVFAVLVVIAFLLESGAPGKHASDTTWVAYYADSGNRHKEELAFFLIGLAGLCFLQFLGSLRGALARAEGEPARITTAAVASGAVFIALATGAHAVTTAVSWSKSFYGGSLTVDPNTARLLASLGFGLFAMSMFAAASMALATTTIAFWMRPFPTWIGVLSACATVAALFGILGLPAIVVLLWIVVLSAYLLLSRPVPGAPPPG